MSSSADGSSTPSQTTSVDAATTISQQIQSLEEAIKAIRRLREGNPTPSIHSHVSTLPSDDISVSNEVGTNAKSRPGSLMTPKELQAKQSATSSGKSSIGSENPSLSTQGNSAAGTPASSINTPLIKPSGPSALSLSTLSLAPSIQVTEADREFEDKVSTLMENKGLDEASAVETVFAEIEEQQRKASLKRIVEAFDNLDSGDPSVQSLIEEQHSIEADLRESLAASRVQEPSEPGTEEVSTGLLKSEDRPASVSDADYRRGRPRRGVAGWLTRRRWWRGRESRRYVMTGAKPSGSKPLPAHNPPPPSEVLTIERDPESSTESKPADEAMFTEGEANPTGGKGVTEPNEIAASAEGKPRLSSHGKFVAVVKGTPPRPGQNDAESEGPGPEPVLIPTPPLGLREHSVGAVAPAA